MSHNKNIEEDEHVIEDLSNDNVVNYYVAASQVVNIVIKAVIAQCVEGKSIIDICAFGDDLIEKEVSKVFNKKKLEKGIAFPTCISINNCVGHFSPLKSDAVVVLKNNDVVKIDLGVQIDGYIALGAHTIIVNGGASGQALAGRTADAVCAAHYAMECALRMIKPGNKSEDVTKVITKVAELYKVNAVAGILSHDLKRWTLDGEKVIFSKAPTGHQRAQNSEFEENEVYCVDIVMSTGDGKTKDNGIRTTVFKRDVNQNYQLKLKSSKELLHEINVRYPALAFSLRSFADETKVRLGLNELLTHQLVNPFPVLFENNHDVVVQFKATVMLLPNGNTKITCTDLPLPFVSSAFTVDDEIKAILAQPMKNDKKSKKVTKKSDAMDTN